MNATEILEWVKVEASSGSNLDWAKVRHEIAERYDHASTDERVILLQIYKAVMDMVERQISQTDLEIFRVTRRQDYNRMLISECVVADGNVSPQALELVTRREVEAGRMSPDDELRKLAVNGPAALAGVGNAGFAETPPVASRWRKTAGWLGRRK